MKPLIAKPDNICGKGPVRGFAIEGESFRPLCDMHLLEVGSERVSMMGDPSHPTNRAFVCYKEIEPPRQMRQPEPPPVTQTRRPRR